MTISIFIRKFTVGIAIALMSSTQSFASADFKQIAEYFVLPLDAMVDYKQQPSLGKEYSQYFKSTRDFNYNTANEFGINNPRQIVAFRNYLQQLVDDGYIEQTAALSSLRGAVLGAIKTFTAQQEALMERPVQRDERDEREVASGMELDQVQASISKKFDGVSERVDALARLNNLSEAQLNDRQIEADAKLEEFGAAFDLRMQELEDVTISRIDSLDQQLGALSEDQFRTEIQSLLQQMDMIQSDAAARLQSAQNEVDNALFEIFAQISKSASKSEQREQQFIDNELRLFRDTSDLRARIKRLEEAVNNGANGANKASTQAPVSQNRNPDPVVSITDEPPSEIVSEPKRETKQESIEANPGLVGAARVISKPTQQLPKDKQLNFNDSPSRTNWSSESSPNR